MNLQEKMVWATRHKRALESFIYVEFIDRPPSRMPYIEFGEDENCYTDGQRIHIGMDKFDPDDENALFWDVYYILGHELQHLKSTTNRDWTAAIKGGIRHICEAIAKTVLKKKVRLVKDSDFERFMKDVADQGYCLSMGRLGSFVHFICNSLEDGRIEAIRSKAQRTFFKYMKRYRARVWDSDSVEKYFGDREPVAEADMDPLTKLQIVLNQVLTLATTGIYQKHFLKEYGHGQLVREVQACIPNIARAVTSRTCRGCMKEAGELIIKLEPLLIEASKMSDFEVFMAQLAEMVKSAILSEYSASAKSEEQGDGKPGESLFGTSALVLELDEEEYEKLKESDEGDVENPSVVMVKKGSDKDLQEDSETGENAGDEESSAEPQADSEPKGSAEKSADAKDASDVSDDEKSDDSKGAADLDGDKSTSSVKAESAGSMSDEEIEELARKAKEAPPTPEIELSDEDIQKQSSFASKMSGFITQPSPITDTKGIDVNYDYDIDFVEENRDYVPDSILPVILESKGNSLKSKVKAMLRQKRKPDERGMRAGALDSGRLTSLMFSDSTCFKRRGEEEEPDIAGFLLMDNSGSMGNGQGSNRFYCSNAIAIIEHAFSELMPLKIAAFDAYGPERVNHVVIKEFDETAPCNFCYNFYSKGRTGCGNKDGYSIRVAIEQLLQRPEEEKVLIVASDGLPSDYHGGYEAGIDDVRSAVEYGRKNGVKVIGMYMFQEQCEADAAAFSQMYEPEYLVVQLDSLEDELARVMKALFR